MKRSMAALLSIVPAIAFATTPFDGTWKMKLDSMQSSGKPTEDVALINGSYTCKSCVPPFTVKADGKDQPTPVHNTRDHLAVKVVSPRQSSTRRRWAARSLAPTLIRYPPTATS